MKIIYVYIVECSDESYYTGITNNTDRRIREHNMGIDKDSYTYSRRPVKLVFCEKFTNPLQAIRFEKQIKGWSRKKKKAIIDGKWELLPELSKSKNPLPPRTLRQTQDDSPQLQNENKCQH